MSTLCKFHGTANGCRYGQSCRYRHLQSNNTNFRSSQTICKYYQSGNCKFGTRCRYSHSIINQPSVIDYEDNDNDTDDDDDDTSKACFIWNINNVQFPLLFDGYIRSIINNKYVTKDIVSLCMDFYLEFDHDLITLLKNLERYNTFRSLSFNIGPFVLYMNISIGYRFDLILEQMPEHNNSIKKLEFICSIQFKEIEKKINETAVILNYPHNEQTINSVIHYFKITDIETFNSFRYYLKIHDLKAFDIDGNDITNLYITNSDLDKKCSVWTTTEDQYLCNK